MTLKKVQDLFETLGLSSRLNGNGRSITIAARMGRESIEVYCFDDCWLTLELLLRLIHNGDSCHQSWEVLCMNSKLNGPVRFVQKEYNSFGIRADIIATGDDSALSNSLKAALDSIERARDVCRESNGQGAVRSDITRAHVDNIKSLCAEAEWDFIDKNDRCAIRLKVPGRIYHADVEGIDPGGYGIRATLVNITEWKSISKDGLSHMLLSVCNRIKMVRPSRFVHVDGAEHVCFESYLSQSVSAREFDLALSALSLACQAVSNEVEVMKSEMIAGEYLACISWPSVKIKHQKKGVKDHERNIIN